MRRIFTSSIFAAALVAASINSSAQTCGTTTTDPGVTNNFNAGSTEGFSGDFTWGTNRLNSSNVGAGSAKVLNTAIYYTAPGQTTLNWRFVLGGQANVNSYAITYETANDGTHPLCSGGALASGTYFFTAPVPVLVSPGENFILHITYTISGGNGQNITIDDFGINVTAAAGTLPVKFSSFDAKSANGNINLIWNVGVEENVAAYEVEKSADGRSYETIGTVDAIGETTYSFVDTKASDATAYYRIKAVDVDGKLTFSPIVTVKGGRSSITLKAFPMPVISDLTLQHTAASTDSKISISTADGRTVKSIVPSKGTQQTVISLASFQPGVYVIRYTDGNGNAETLKIVKQ